MIWNRWDISICGYFQADQSVVISKWQIIWNWMKHPVSVTSICLVKSVGQLKRWLLCLPYLLHISRAATWLVLLATFTGSMRYEVEAGYLPVKQFVGISKCQIIGNWPGLLPRVDQNAKHLVFGYIFMVKSVYLPLLSLARCNGSQVYAQPSTGSQHRWHSPAGESEPATPFCRSVCGHIRQGDPGEY